LTAGLSERQIAEFVEDDEVHTRQMRDGCLKGVETIVER
jgi:hypothetical protein